MRSTVPALGFADVQVQNFGTARDVMIRLPAQKGVSSAQQSDKVLAALKAADPAVTLRRTEFVGPQVGEELATDGLKALAMVVVGIMLYLAFRFEWKFAVAAIIANLHDVVIILGFFAFFQWEFSLAVLAAVLAVLGYSVNESVVIFDRIRENFRRYRKMNTVQIIDNAITSTISRTIITHGSTQIMVLSMLLFGGADAALFRAGADHRHLFGIYSSVFVAAAIAMWLGIKREDLVKAPAQATTATRTTRTPAPPSETATHCHRPPRHPPASPSRRRSARRQAREQFVAASCEGVLPAAVATRSARALIELIGQPAPSTPRDAGPARRLVDFERHARPTGWPRTHAGLAAGAVRAADRHAPRARCELDQPRADRRRRGRKQDPVVAPRAWPCRKRPAGNSTTCKLRMQHLEGNEELADRGHPAARSAVASCWSSSGCAAGPAARDLDAWSRT